ncbi:MAG: hypothetical protein AAFY98_12235 [Verrucomicrobiota bacterium]
MGIDNRDYMRKEPRGSQSIPEYRPKKSKSSLTWWESLKFNLWRLFKGK